MFILENEYAIAVAYWNRPNYGDVKRTFMIESNVCVHFNNNNIQASVILTILFEMYIVRVINLNAYCRTAAQKK